VKRKLATGRGKPEGLTKSGGTDLLDIKENSVFVFVNVFDNIRQINLINNIKLKGL